MTVLLSTCAALPRTSIASTSSSRRTAALPSSARIAGHPGCALPRNRGHRRSTHIVSYRWDDNSDAGGGFNNTTTTTDKNNTKNVAKPSSLYDTSPEAADQEEEAALQQMQREERLRDVQRAASEAFQGAKSWWAGVPNKRTLLLGGAAAAAAAYLGGAVMEAVDRVPLLPRVLQAVGLGYSGWFWWRYVLFAEGRRQLAGAAAAARAGVLRRVEEVGGQQQPRQGGGEERDDGSWVDAEEVTAAPLDGRYVEGLLRELDEQARGLEGGGSGTSAAGGGSAPGGGGRPPVIFALMLGPGGGGEVWATQPGAEEGEGGGSSPKAASPDLTDPRVADLDPCLGWDTEACAATGHLKLGEPDGTKLDELASVASRQAREALGFSRHVDQVLHAPVQQYQQPHAPGPLEPDLEGEHGRAAGTMEREAMEEFAAKNRNVMSAGSSRKPAMGEEAAIGP